MKQNTPRYAVIMGATSGIGLSVTRLLAQEGWKVGLAGRNKEMLEKLKQTMNEVVAIAAIDARTTDAGHQLNSLFLSMGHPVNLYFHSAGIGWNNITLDSAHEMDTVSTNVEGFTRCILTAYQYFATYCNGNGHIVAITSIAGTKGLGSAPSYSASKRYQSHYLEALEQNARMKGLSLRITDIQPGFVKTPLLKGDNYPILLNVDQTAQAIVKVLKHPKRRAVIDWKYRLLVFFWKFIPSYLWVRMNIRK